MDLVFYFLVVTVISVGSVWLQGIIYGLVRRPAIWFPFHLAAKMAITTVFGTLFLMIGGVILSTLVFNAEMKKRDDYRQWSTLLVGVVISSLSLVVIYLAAFRLAFAILD